MHMHINATYYCLSNITYKNLVCLLFIFGYKFGFKCINSHELIRPRYDNK